MFFPRTGEVHMDEGPIHRTLLVYAAPILISQILQQLYNIADCVIVGRFCGPFALAAVGVAGLILAVHINFFIGFSVGVSALTSRLFGARDYERLKRAIASMVYLAALVGLLLASLGVAFGPGYLSWLSCPADTMADAERYLAISMLGLPPQLVYNVANAVLRSLGNTRTALFYLAASSALNLALDLLLAAWLGLGLAGAAWATLAAQWALGIAIAWRLTRLDGRYRFTLRTRPLSLRETIAVLRLGIPSGMQAAFMSLSSLLIQVSIDSFGAAAMAGMTIYAKIEGFLYYPAFSYGMALTGFIGQNLGAGRLDRVEEAMRISRRTTIVMTLLLSGGLLLVARPLLACFTTDEAILQNGLSAVWWTFPFYFLYSLNQVYIGGLKGLGETGVPMLSALFAYALFRVAWCAALLPRYHDMAVIYNAYNASFLVSLVILIPAYRHFYGRVARPDEMRSYDPLYGATNI